MTIDELKNLIIQNHQDYSDNTLSKIIKRLNLLNGLGLSLYSSDMVRLSTKDLYEIEHELDDLLVVQLVLISRLLRMTAYNEYNSTKKLYDVVGKKFIPLEANKELAKDLSHITNDIKKDYKKTLDNLAYKTKNNNGGYTVNSPKNTYKKIIADSISNKQSLIGNSNTPNDVITPEHNEYIKKNNSVVKRLIGAKLLTVLYDVHGKRSLHQIDSFLDNLLENGMRSIRQKILDFVGNTLGTDGVEISVHQRPAEDHAPVQGHQFSNEEFIKMQSDEIFQDIQGRYYNNFIRKIGTWNCRHLVYPIFIGKNKPQYTDWQLQDILDENVKGYIMPNGKHKTLYECNQHENYLKKKVTQLKSAKKLAKVYGNKELINSISSELEKAKEEYKLFKKTYGTKSKVKS